MIRQYETNSRKLLVLFGRSYYRWKKGKQKKQKKGKIGKRRRRRRWWWWKVGGKNLTTHTCTHTHKKTHTFPRHFLKIVQFTNEKRIEAFIFNAHSVRGWNIIYNKYVWVRKKKEYHYDFNMNLAAFKPNMFHYNNKIAI